MADVDLDRLISGIGVDAAEAGALNEQIGELRTAMVNEKLSPEVLPYRTDLVADLLEQLENQQEIIDEAGPEDKWEACLYQMEIDRVSYMLKTYLRSRLLKIQRYAKHYCGVKALRSRLSPAELDFAQGYEKAMSAHFRDMALESMPEKFRQLPTATRRPKLDNYVFCSVKRDLGEVNVGDGADDDVSAIELEKDDVYILRYRTMKGLVESGDVSMI